MVSKLLCTAVLLLGATALRADVFSFSYAGTFFGNTTSVIGTLSATSVIPGIYTITDLSGTRNGVAISDPSSSDKGTFIFSDSSGVGTLSFLLNGNSKKSDDVTFAAGVYKESGTTGTNIGSTFSITRVPEAATLSLLFTMGFGVWLFTRKLSSKKAPLS